MPQELGWFWMAFWELDTCRQHVEGVPYRVPWTSAKEYADHHDLVFDYFWTIISTMDRGYVAHKVKEHNAKVEEMAKKNKSSPNKTGRRHGR